jgi:hypothetical protein
MHLSLIFTTFCVCNILSEHCGACPVTLPVRPTSFVRQEVLGDWPFQLKVPNDWLARHEPVRSSFPSILVPVCGKSFRSRTIADVCIVLQGDGPAAEQLVIATPEVRHQTMDDTSSFLILACDGIWDILTNEEAVQFVEKLALEGKSPKEVCESMCDRCLAPSTEGIGKGCDNMSAIVVYLQKQHAKLVAKKVLQTSSAVRAASPPASTADSQLPASMNASGQAVGESLTPSSPGSQSTHDAGACPRQQQLSLPKTFEVRRTQVPASSLRGPRTMSVKAGCVTMV